jgi:predicted aldo/keto reductase-like oxidoreductase
VLGRTGELVPVLGLGSAPGGMGLKDEDAIALYHQAIDLGVTYVDTAPAYERAQRQLGEVLRTRRREVFLVTKAVTAEASKALEILEANLEELQTEQVDLAFVHSLGNLDVDRVLARDGALAGMREAQRRGWTRYVGFSAHNAPWKAAKVLRETDVDAVMLAMNPGDRHTYHFEEEVLPIARERGVGVAAMKVYGGAKGMKYETVTPSALGAHGDHDHRPALRYALGLPGVSVAVIGMYSEEELRRNVAWAGNCRPLTKAEERKVLSLGRTLSKDWGPHYGPVQ